MACFSNSRWLSNCDRQDLQSIEPIVIKSGLILTFFNGLAAMLGLIRNIMIARLLSVDDFGIASTFAMTMAFVDMSANVGIDRLIVQAKDGQSERFQSTLQSFQVLRGLFGGVALFLLAAPLAKLFGTPNALWAYQLMALIPVIRGFANLDLNRFQRLRKFGPSITTETSAQVVSTTIALGMAYHGSDYRAMLFALIAQQMVSTILSQAFAERRFKFNWDPHIIKQAIDFGWPLLINGALLFGAFHGDRIIIGNQMGTTVLGWFSVAYMLTLLPANLLAKVVQTLCLPVLSQHQDNENRFANLAYATAEAACLIGVFIAVGNALVGGLLVQYLFGTKHMLATSVLVPLAVMQAVRVAKAGPSIIAIAKRQTTNPMWANLIRVAVLPVAFYVASRGGSVVLVVWIALLGELAGLLLSYLLLAKKSHLSAVRLVRMLLALCLCISVPLLYDYLNPGQARAILHFPALVLIAATVIYLLTLTNLIDWLLNRSQNMADHT
jgi:O-antigen/teichoic acid export membrane protein